LIINILQFVSPSGGKCCAFSGLRLNRDSIVTSATFKGIPAGIFNFAVFRCLSEKEFDKALQFAWIQVQMNPSDANAWYTLGEVYYFMGRKNWPCIISGSIK
jgi:hypothetical protein